MKEKDTAHLFNPRSLLYYDIHAITNSPYEIKIPNWECKRETVAPPHGVRNHLPSFFHTVDIRGIELSLSFNFVWVGLNPVWPKKQKKKLYLTNLMNTEKKTEIVSCPQK